jgi:hypothetical protein
MNRFANRSRATLLASCVPLSLALAGAVLSGCGETAAGTGASSPGGASETTGKVSLPLITVVGSHSYRLSNVWIYLYGAQYGQLTSDDNSDETTLSTPLRTGDYTAYLQSWRLERIDGAGVYQPVDASLVSSSQVSFTVFNGTTSTVSFEFQTDGVIVRVGTGTLTVKADVDELPAACTPFGTDCPEGAWCPPTGLTGISRGCISAGQTEVGQPCVSPLDCVANASCYGTGTGALCVALCPAEGFEMACSSGGTCQANDDEYGTCQP